MKIWRVMHPDVIDPLSGLPIGPYKATPGEWNCHRVAMGRAHIDSAHLCPFYDPKLEYHIDADEMCAFNSRYALDAWFDGWAERLQEAGFVVGCYEVPDSAIRVGGFGQAVFTALEARSLGCEPW